MTRWLVPVLLTGWAQAQPLTLEAHFRVQPERAEVWLLRDQQYEYLGQARDTLPIAMDRRDLGRRPSVFRIFYRRPWERHRQEVPPRAHSVTLMLRPEDTNLWPEQGTYQLGWEDRLLDSAGLRWGLAGAGLLGIGGGLLGRSRRRRRLQAERTYQLLEAAKAIGSSLTRDDLLLFTRNAIERSVSTRAGMILHQGAALVEWGTQTHAVDSQALREVCDFLSQTRGPLVLGHSESPFRNPFQGLPALLAVPMLVGGKSEGYILVARDDAQGLDELAAATLSGVAAQVGLVLMSYRQRDQEKRQHRDQAVGRLAAGVAHELNTPLGAVLLAVDSAMTVLQSSPEKAGVRLQKAASGVERAHRIVDDLLLFSKGAPERLRDLDLGERLEEAGVRFAERLENAGIRIETDCRKGLEVRGDPQQWDHALSHLLQNSLDALEDHFGSRRVQLRAFREEPQTIVLEVEDNGPGMKAEVLESACDPFFTTRPVGKGTGLGLAAARRVAEIHGGRLELASTPGQGTRVSVRVPIS